MLKTAGWDRGEGPARQSSPLSNPALSWLWLPQRLVAWWPREGGGSSCPGPQALGMPPLSSPRVPSPVYKAQGAKESVWPRQFSLEAQRRKLKPEERPSHSPMPGSLRSCWPAVSQSPWHLTCGPLGAPRVWDLGQGRKAECCECLGGGWHACPLGTERWK